MFPTKRLWQVGYTKSSRLLFPPQKRLDKKMSNYTLNERQDCLGDDKPRQTTRRTTVSETKKITKREESKGQPESSRPCAWSRRSCTSAAVGKVSAHAVSEKRILDKAKGFASPTLTGLGGRPWSLPRSTPPDNGLFGRFSYSGTASRVESRQRSGAVGQRNHWISWPLNYFVMWATSTKLGLYDDWEHPDTLNPNGQVIIEGL